MIDAMSSPPPAVSMYCLGCFYDLRGLPESRCPECGRLFNPANHRTFSPVAESERLKQFANNTIAGAMQRLAPDTTARVVHMERRLASAAVENARLRDYIANLIASLVERGSISSEEAEQIFQQVENPLAVVIDEDEGIVEESDPPPSAELLELGRIVAGQERSQPPRDADATSAMVDA
ncbi:MAG: hypothetical protein JWP03_952 [Phycisphaerales bacterium]|nr:hypothetical protein [Phycisphaerales bacterium]